MSAADLKGLIEREVELAIDLAESQEPLREALGYESTSSISKIAAGTQALPRAKAELLDEWLTENDRTTECGISMVALVDVWRQAVRIEKSKTTDVFLACPMSAGGKGRYQTNRKLAMAMVKALGEHQIETYFAGEKLHRPSEFDAHDLSYKANLRHIEDSKLFVLYLPPSPTEPELGPPSSVWIELGMALARNLPVTIFAQSPEDLPFVVKQAVVADDARGRPILDVRYYGTKPRRPALELHRHGRAILAGGSTL